MKYILKVINDDAKGLVYNISKVIYENNLNIIQNSEFVDKPSQRFFFRAILEGDINTSKIKSDIQRNLPDATISLNKKLNKKIIVMGTKESHALGDLLIKNFSEELGADIQAVISNHDSLKALVEKFDIPYHHITHQNISKEEHEQEILNTLNKYDFDYIILAKYMRILSANFVQSFKKDQIINIHHSFLPAFKGADPYKQALNRGVKVLGASAHFVNENLDEGLIISQDTMHINHSLNLQDMKRAGQLIETKVLLEALHAVFDDKVFTTKDKTIIL